MQLRLLNNDTATILLQHFIRPARPHNPLIAGAFFRTGDVESWGRGIEKARTACQETGTDFPTFRFEPTGLMVMFKGRIPVEAVSSETEGDVLVKTPADVSEASGKRRDNAQETVGKTAGEILRILQANPKITHMGLSERLQLSIRWVKWNLTKMKRDGLIRRIGPKKGGHWEVTGEYVQNLHMLTRTARSLRSSFCLEHDSSRVR
ncbi:MAG: ATP-binding protein [Thermodesulfobacteriota bacterium]